MVPEQTPLLGLRMKPSLFTVPSSQCADDIVESIATMRAQDKSYACRDYLGRRLGRKGFSSYCGNSALVGQPDDLADASCREKMCEWSYRVCDHFHTSREIVAFAFSFLDRFLDKCSCDRTAFKLAAMTALYMSTKLHNPKQISIASLSELSRGEFEQEHIAEMERIILETLEWRMNPPTVQAFVDRLLAFLPTGDANTALFVHERATFFAELTVYDYKFVTQDRMTIAVACMLNAVEGLDDMFSVEQIRSQFLGSLRLRLNIEIDQKTLEGLQARLWYLYSCSAQMQCDDVLPLYVAKSHGSKSASEPGVFGAAHSPVSVSIPGRF